MDRPKNGRAVQLVLLNFDPKVGWSAIHPWLTSDQGTRSSDGKGTLAIAVDQACQDLGWPGFFNISTDQSFQDQIFMVFKIFKI